MTDNPTGHLYSIFYGDLGMCGCGNPEEAYTLIRDLLALTPYYEGSNWQRVNDLIGTPAAVHMVLSALNKAGLIEHGTSTLGSWLTPKGQYALTHMCQVSFDDMDEAGFPHDGDACVPECWKVTDSVG